MRELAPYLFQGLCLLAIATLWVLSPKVPQFAVVDMNALISKGSQGLAKNGRTSRNEIEALGTWLKQGLEAFGQERKLILLSKGAVVAGSLSEVTEEVSLFLDAGGNQ